MRTFYEWIHRKDFYGKMLLSFIIIIITLRYVGKIFQPTILDDEFAYIGIAKCLTGKDWTSVMSYCKYYSYGYSLWLVPLVWNIKSPILLYVSICALNSVFMIGAFALMNRVITEFLRRWDMLLILDLEEPDTQIKISLLSFTVVTMPCFMNYASVGMAECLLLFEFLLAVRLVQHLDIEAGIWLYICLGFLSVYMYATHQRMIAASIAIAAVMIVRLVQKKVKRYQAAVYFTVSGIFFGAHVCMKEYVKSQIYRGSSSARTNDFGSVGDILSYIFSGFAALAKTMVSVVGKVFYMGSATYLFGLIGIAAIVFLIVRKRAISDSASLFVVISFVLGLGVMAVYMYEPGNLTSFVYGRYLETYFPLLTAMGVIFLLEYREERWFRILAAGTVAVYILSTLVVKIFCLKWDLRRLNYISAGQIYKYMRDDKLQVLLACVVSIAIFLLLAGVVHDVIWNIPRNETRYLFVIACFMTALSLWSAHVPMKDINLELQESRRDTDIVGLSVIYQLKAFPQAEFVYLIDEEEETSSAQYMEYVQYWMRNVPLVCKEAVLDDNGEAMEELMKQLPPESIVISSSNRINDILTDKESPVFEDFFHNEMCRMYRVKE